MFKINRFINTEVYFSNILFFLDFNATYYCNPLFFLSVIFSAMNIENDDKDYRDDTIPEEKRAYPITKTKANSPYWSLKNRASVERVKHDGRNNGESSPAQPKCNSSLAIMKPAKNIDSWLNSKVWATDVKPTRKANRYDYQRSSFADDELKSRALLRTNVESMSSLERKQDSDIKSGGHTTK